MREFSFDQLCILVIIVDFGIFFVVVNVLYLVQFMISLYVSDFEECLGSVLFMCGSCCVQVMVLGVLVIDWV